MDIEKRINRIPATIRRFLIALNDAFIIICTYYLSFYIRFEGKIPPNELVLFYQTLPPILAIRFGLFYIHGLYRGIWRYASVEDLLSILRAISLGSIAVYLLFHYLLGFTAIPRTVFIIDWLLLIILVGGSRFAIRTIRASRLGACEGKRVLIFGAGDTGEALLRDLKQHPSQFHVIGLIDDDPAKQGKFLHGVPVLGQRQHISELAQKYKVQEIYIAIPTVGTRVLRELLGQFRETGITFRSVPALLELVDGRVTVQHLKQVDLEDLLCRQPIHLDLNQIEKFLTDKTVLVTGAGGSIGSVLCKHILRFKPRRLLMLDQAECGLYHLGIELKENGMQSDGNLVVGNITDEVRIKEVFEKNRPEVVFHAAAHKHVPMMEFNKKEAIRNNVLGTRVLGEVALHYQVEKFVMISTDKAVNPTSVMGASKRIAEMFLLSLAGMGLTNFITVRFGNVLGSEGSVVPLFKKQIAAGGPITITHPDIERYFMTIPEAVQLVLQAGAMGTGCEIYILDMGEPIKIIDLARNLIVLSGYKVDDVPIDVVGMRPGEKMSEELWIQNEDIKPTSHKKIKVAVSGMIPTSFQSRVDILLDLVNGGTEDDIIQALRSMVTAYTPCEKTKQYALPVTVPL